ncbi:hypothetical protein [Embleya scabrispora]|uniref:hypothetical protein n=1 Tax=Embleya scabrispora TaxID=159449 RepID=UPI001374E2E0|nr:hypothetical protein [Embleya scabrispora]
MLRFALGALAGTLTGAIVVHVTDRPALAVLVGLGVACVIWAWRLVIDAIDEVLDVLT